MNRIPKILFILTIFLIFFAAKSYSSNLFEGKFNLLNININFNFDNEVVFQNNDEDDDNDDDIIIDIEDISDNPDNPIIKIIPYNYYENPFRRFEIIFFASFSYIFFLNITIIETVTQVAPSDYGVSLMFDNFPLPLFFYTFISSFIFSLAVAIEDYRFVYIENAPKDGNTNSNDGLIVNKNNKINFYFAPKVYFHSNFIIFRIFLLTF